MEFTEFIRLWMGGLLTLMIFSFLYKDNPFYKFAEHLFVGVSAAYAMVVAFWSTLWVNALGAVIPQIQAWTATDPGEGAILVAQDPKYLRIP